MRMLLGLGVLGSALGATLRVPEDYPTIGQAILVAASGDAIAVGPGSWAGFSVAIPLTIRSTGGAAVTTLTGAANLIQVDAGGALTMDGFRLIPTGTRGLRVRTGGALIASHLTMSDVTLSQTGAFALIESGGTAEFYDIAVQRVALGGNRGVLDVDGDVFVKDAVFDGNSAQGGGAFAYLETNNAKLVVSGGTFSSGSATRGGAIYVNGGALAISEGARFTGNTATTEGGAIYVTNNNALVDIRDATFASNTAPKGGALYQNQGAGITTLRSTFCANRATAGAGGAFYTDTPTGTSTWTNNLYVENSATTEGGAVYALKPASALITNNTFVGNAAGINGGAALRLKTSGAATVTNNAFANSSAGTAVVRDPGVSGSASYDAWYANTPAHQTGYTLDATHLIDANPLLTTYTANGNCDDDQLWPAKGSPLIDRGDTAVIDDDGSRSDIGAYGGPGGLTIPDVDGDGFLAGPDCDDTDATVHPGATEVCDDADNDCDGATDEAGATGSVAWYPDVDNDGFGAGSATMACAEPLGHAASSDDCDDTDAAYHPGAPELCTDLFDYNCDGSLARVDADNDGHVACEECDDSDATIHPGAAERCDGVDNDCDAAIDEAGAVGEVDWYGDGDADGHGAGAAMPACEAPTGTVDSNDDCDDTDDRFHPGATETCTDAVDFNCDGSVAQEDRDSDGYVACEECADNDASVHPGAAELCDGRDQDCDGSVPADEQDADGDTFRSCAGDCDDGDLNVYPGAPDEPGDGIDGDCDGTDAGDVDADGDGFAGGADCDDEDAGVHPDAADIPNDGVDQNCSGADADALYVGGLPGDCGCHTTGTTLDSSLLLFGLLTAAARRRRA